MTTVEPRYALDLFVPGRPAAQGSKRHVGGGRLIEQSAAVAPWRALVALAARDASPGSPAQGAVSVAVDFVMPRPASCPKRSTPAAVKRPDIDKMLRALFDALSGIAWVDDSQVVDVQAGKRLAALDETPGAHVSIRSIGGL